MCHVQCRDADAELETDSDFEVHKIASVSMSNICNFMTPCKVFYSDVQIQQLVLFY